MILGVNIGHGMFHPVAVLGFYKSVFLGKVLIFQIGEPQKSVVHLYRRTRQNLLKTVKTRSICVFNNMFVLLDT